MPDLYALCSNVRLRLGDPRANKPGDFQVLHQVCTQIRTIKRHQRNTSNPWNFNDLTIQVVANQDVYQINAADFGTPLALYTYDPTNPAWVARLVDFYLPQNMPFDWGYQQNAAWAFTPWDGTNCTAQRCAFYWRDGNAFVEFQPLPQLAATYRVRYLQSANGVNDAALTSSPISNEDADLCEVRSAIALLPLTEWDAPQTKDGRAANAERRRDLTLSLSAEERELTRQFEAAQLITTGPRTTVRWNPCDG